MTTNKAAVVRKVFLGSFTKRLRVAYIPMIQTTPTAGFIAVMTPIPMSNIAIAAKPILVRPNNLFVSANYNTSIEAILIPACKPIEAGNPNLSEIPWNIRPAKIATPIKTGRLCPVFCESR